MRGILLFVNFIFFHGAVNFFKAKGHSIDWTTLSHTAESRGEFRLLGIKVNGISGFIEEVKRFS